jgi:signal transduction histidine kinase
VAASEELLALIDAGDDSGDQQPVAKRDMCSVVVESSRHMLSLINDVLDFERMGTNQVKIERIPFRLDKEFGKLVKVRTTKQQRRLLQSRP